MYWKKNFQIRLKVELNIDHSTLTYIKLIYLRITISAIEEEIMWVMGVEILLLFNSLLLASYDMKNRAAATQTSEYLSYLKDLNQYKCKNRTKFD